MSASARRKIVEQHIELDQLRQRVAELESENSRLKQVNRVSIPTNTMEQWAAGEIRLATNRLREQLAASQLREKQLRDALENIDSELKCMTKHGNVIFRDVCKTTEQALDLPQDDSALREYLAGKMKPLVDAANAVACAFTSPEVGSPIHRLQEALEAARKELVL